MTISPDVDLHELIDLPGAGKARERCQEVGYWDPYADDGPEREFSAELIGNLVRPRATVTVLARSEREARDKAVVLAEKGMVDWETDDPDDFEIETCIDSEPLS